MMKKILFCGAWFINDILYDHNLKCLFLFVMKEVITCCLYSLQWWAICILADPPALNMCPPILKVIWRIWELILCSDQDMKLLIRRGLFVQDSESWNFQIFIKIYDCDLCFPLTIGFIQLLLDGLVMKCLWRINKVLTAPFFGSLQ